MNILLVAILGAMTYVSRAIGLALVPQTEGRVQAILNRLPAGVFAGLAVVSLLDDSGSLRSIPTLAAAGFAVAVSPTRSLPLIFAAGITGYFVAGFVF